MRGTVIAGLVLIVLGVAALVYQGVTYTTQKKAVDMGPIQITEKQKHTVPVPPIVGGIAVVAGIALVALGGKRG
jgi:UDP-N-acetylmuramyl pentapeptide phosphotransferase/UDP-N-acetylglucosamine-1-phosphate transferase